jgi:hypothetical protein
MTLFPISIIRSIQATNLTNATILAKRADALIDMYGLVTDTYIPQPAEGYQVHAVIDPFGWHDLFADTPALAQEYGNNGSGGVVRYAPLSLPVFNNETGQGGPLKYVDLAPAAGGGRIPLRRISYAVNPVNFPVAQQRPAVFPEPFGVVQFPIFPMPGSQLGRDSVLAAVGLPDSFNSVFEAEPDALDPGPPQAVAFNAAVDLSYAETHPAGYGPSSNPNLEVKLVPGSRVVLIDDTGRRSQVRQVSYDDSGAPYGLRVYPTGTAWVIDWDDPLPASFTSVSQARLEIPQSRYTWMLTVRKRGTTGGSVTEIDCVTFFNRQTGDPTQEIVYPAFAPNPRLDNTNYLTGYPAGQTPPSDLLTIDFSATGTAPAVKKGRFVFDPTNCLWYRVLNILAETEMPGSITVQLERDAESETPITGVIVPEGVINVFPLSSRVDQSRLDQARRVSR